MINICSDNTSSVSIPLFSPSPGIFRPDCRSESARTGLPACTPPHHSINIYGSAKNARVQELRSELRSSPSVFANPESNSVIDLNIQICSSDSTVRIDLIARFPFTKGDSGAEFLVNNILRKHMMFWARDSFQGILRRIDEDPTKNITEERHMDAQKIARIHMPRKSGIWMRRR